MDKFDFQYRQHELDDLRTRTIYQSTYEQAIEDFIDWIHHNGYIGYFEDKTVLGNPVYRKHVEYTEDLTHASIQAYVLQYLLIDLHAEGQMREQKKVQLYMSDAINEFLSAIKELSGRENVKNIVAYKGTLVEFDYRQL